MSVASVVPPLGEPRLRNLVEVARCAPLRSVRVGLLGYGGVGQAVARLIDAEGHRLRALGLDVHATIALVRDPQKRRRAPLLPLTTGDREFFASRLDLVVDVMGGIDPACDYVRSALERGVPVVTANKTLMAAKGPELRSIAVQNGTALAFDAAVLAGVPFLGALARRPFVNAPRRITGIINGTSHFLLSALAHGGSFDETLADAISRGYAEPDSRADVGGRDAAEKLTILLHLAGADGLSPADITTTGIDVLTRDDFSAAKLLGGVLKPLAIASLEPGSSGAWVGPALVDRAHPSAASRGVFNFMEFAFAGPGRLPVTFSGPGAGPDVTAATILDDVVEVLTFGPRPDSRAMSGRAISRHQLSAPPPGPWYVRIAAGPGIAIDDAAEVLDAHRLRAPKLARTSHALVAKTVSGPWPRIQEVAEIYRSRGANVLVLPIVEGQ